MGYKEGGAAAGAAAGSVIPGVGTAIGAGLGWLGGGIADWFSGQSAQNMNWDMFVSNQQFNANAITSARQFEADMSNTAIWRRKMDLEKSGINPMLAAGDVGASTPGAPIANPGVGNAIQPNQAISRGIQSAIQGLGLMKDMAKADADIALTNMQAVTEAAKAERETWAAREHEENIGLKAWERKALETSYKSLGAKTEAEKEKAKLDIKYGNTERIMRLIQQGTGAVNNAVDAATSAIPSKGAARMLRRGQVGRSLENFDLERAGSKGISYE